MLTTPSPVAPDLLFLSFVQRLIEKLPLSKQWYGIVLTERERGPGRATGTHLGDDSFWSLTVSPGTHGSQLANGRCELP